MKTHHLNKDTVVRNWYELDAEGMILGRLASQIAIVLRGKHKPTFSPHVDGGDFVVVTNADKLKFTGQKVQQKLYHHHSGYPGGMKYQLLADVLKKHPERVLRRAVWGMLPKGPLGRRQIKKLKLYTTSDHPHYAQKPQPFPL